MNFGMLIALTGTVFLSKAAEAVVSKSAWHSGGVHRRDANVLHTFRPQARPNADTLGHSNLAPTTNVSLSYAAQDDSPGRIDMTLVMDNPAVVLEDIETITGAVCGDDFVTVSFSSSEDMEEALEDWGEEDAFILVTNNFGNCDAEFERGFFLAKDMSPNVEDLTITVTASREDLTQVAGTCEMNFSSLPAATLTKRIVLDPSLSLTFSEGLDPNTVLYSDGQYFDIIANEASFTTTITFSGYLHYDFLAFELKDLYFDINTRFEADLALSAEASVPYSTSFKYAPDELTYSLVSVPGLVSLGPGIAFAVGVDVDVSAAVGVSSGVSATIPNGNVHVDFLRDANTGASGWEPQYAGYANITEAADVHLDASAELTVELVFDLLGGLVDLSSGITATPGFDNKFTLRGEQGVGIDGTMEVASNGVQDDLACAKTNGVELKTDFYFKLGAFATEWWDMELYSVVVPLWDYCYTWA